MLAICRMFVLSVSLVVVILQCMKVHYYFFYTHAGLHPTMIHAFLSVVAHVVPLNVERPSHALT